MMIMTEINYKQLGTKVDVANYNIEIVDNFAQGARSRNDTLRFRKEGIKNGLWCHI